MEEQEAEKVTSVRSPSPMEQAVEEKHPADLTAPEVKEVACIIPEKVVGGSPVAQVRLHSPKPTDGDKVDDLEIAASRDELQTTSSAKGETVPGSEAAYIGAESNQLPSPSDGSDALIWLPPDDGAEPHFMLLSEDEHAPTLEAVQAREEPHRSSCMDEGDILVSESFPLGVEHSAPVLVERGEASVPDVSSPPTNGMESALELAQPGAEPVIACAIGTDGIAEYGIEMAGDLAEATVNEFTEEVVDFAEEAVESAGEEVEVACSVDNASENEHSTVVDMKRRGGRKRKRGRPSSKLNGTRFPSQKKDEEEVCFICFDGGDLVVCDRRGCPKVYHPSCVNREEEYFRSKGQWSCGWHLCSKCHKSASYKCYTCTYSLCKLCINEEEFTCIRGNKGFCTACMTTILLMETSDNTQEKKDVDFNDRSCWEYLFKDYWLELKAKLSINLNELTNAGVASKMCALDSGNEESSDDGQGASSDRSSACHDESIPSKNKLKITRNTYKITRKAVQTKGIPSPEVTSRKRTRIFSRNSVPESPKKEEKYEVSVRLENPLMIKEKKRCKKPASEVGTVNGDESKLAVHKNKPSRKKSKRRPRRTLEKNNSLDDKEEQTTAAENTDWASKELLEFVSHVKNGDDKSILSPYEVQELLLDYIKVNKLRDPRKKSQIICDAMLLRLFDKPRVGHFEMLKLLESHFHIKVSSPASDENQAGTDPIQVGAEISNVLDGSMITDKQRITRKIVESKEQTNLYCYAAIDLHNINMMYLRRYWMEDLIDDMSTFSEKVIGSFVRIRVTTSSQRQEVYRLVQVVGCGKAPEEYKTGRKTTDVMLEVINLDKKEAITIDIISNQDFTEEECKRLRQSIKFGFISRLTVGEVQEKARVLQAVRISDILESEKLRLTHLRDRASEKGKKKEHRECVEKLHLLNSPEEQKKRLCDIAQAHADPKMDPGYESSDDDGDEEEIKKGNPGRPVHSTFKEKELISPQKEGYNLGGTPKSSNTIIASHNNGAHNNNSVETHIIEEKVEALLDNKAPERETTILPESKLEASLAQAVSPSIASENEKQWHYKDPSGKIQGPFSLVQLKKWSKHFPSNLAIWRKSERQEDSILLTDALAGNLQKDLPEWLPLNAVSLNSPSLSVISSSKIQETSILVQNEKVVGNASCSDSVTNSDIKRNKGSADFYKVSGSEQVAVARAVNTESIQQASYQLTDVHNRTQVISSELDPRKKILEDPGTTHGNGDAIQKQDFSGHHNSNSCSNHGKDPQTDKVADHSTSSTESNNVPEASQPDQTSASFPKSGDSNPSPIIESKALVSSSPQRSDHSTYPMRGPQTQSAHPNSSTQTSNNFPNPVNVPPSQPPPQTFVPSNWNQPLNAIAGDQSVSPSMISTVSSGVSTSVNCQSTPLVSSDSSMQPFSSSQMNHSSMQPFSSSQMNHNMNSVNYQQANMIWDGNNPVWQVQNQYQNLSHMAAAVGNILYGNTNPGWGMMAQGNMTMPWVVPPNANMVWNQAIPMPPQGTAAPNFIQQPPQGNIPSYPVWNAPVQPNANQNPAWAPPVLANTGQVTHENTTMPRGLSNENQSGSSMQMERGSGQRDGGFRGGVPGYGPGRQPRGWMGGGNGGRSSRHQEFDGVCVFHHRYGHCKKGTSCNYSHS